MKLIVKKQMMCLSMLVLLFVGCGADEDELFEISDTPVVSIEKVSVEINDDALFGNDDAIKYTFKVVSDSKVKTDLLVKVHRDVRYYDNIDRTCWDRDNDLWLTIPKGKNESKNITADLGVIYLNGHIWVAIVPLPLINIVGKGEVIDQDELQRSYGGKWTAHGQKIPENFVFPVYKVKNSDSIALYEPKNAKIVDIEHPSGTQFLVDNVPYITVTFDTPPECPQVFSDFSSVNLSGFGKQFDIEINYESYRGLYLNSYIEGRVTLKWGSIEEYSENLIYRIVRYND